MKPELYFPCVLIALSLVSAAVYAFQGNWWKAGYWVAGAAITTCVTFGS